MSDILSPFSGLPKFSPKRCLTILVRIGSLMNSIRCASIVCVALCWLRQTESSRTLSCFHKNLNSFPNPPNDNRSLAQPVLAKRHWARRWCVTFHSTRWKCKARPFFFVLSGVVVARDAEHTTTTQTAKYLNNRNRRTTNELPLAENFERPRIDFVVFLLSMRDRSSFDATKRSIESLVDVEFWFGRSCFVASNGMYESAK